MEGSIAYARHGIEWELKHAEHRSQVESPLRTPTGFKAIAQGRDRRERTLGQIVQRSQP